VSDKNKSAAQKVIDIFGGPSKVAKALGLGRSTVTRWTYPPERSGTDGHIPGKYHQQIVNAAKEQGLVITAEDLVSANQF